MFKKSFLRVSSVLALAFTFFPNPVFAAPTEASRLRILLVIDTLADNGPHLFGAAEDRNNMVRTIRDAMKSQKLEGHYTLTVLQGKQVTPANVLSYYKKLPTNSSEALFFYYTGHGCMHRSQGQILSMSGGSLHRSKLSQAMLAHHPRLAVILTDCCSNFVGAPPKPAGPGKKSAPAQSSTASSRIDPIKTTPRLVVAGSGYVLRDLFFRHQGLVVIGAAKGGQTAGGNPQRGGGYFTVALCKLLKRPAGQLDRNHDGFIEWREFYPFLRQETERVSRAGGMRHSPQAFKLGQTNRN